MTDARRRRRTTLIVLVPILAVATLVLGLRIGAGGPERGARIWAAPPGKPLQTGGPSPLAWQIFTYLDDRGVREATSLSGLTLVLRSKGHEARWQGASNADGIAEATLALPDVASGDPIEVELRAPGERDALASGVVELPSMPFGRAAEDAPAQSLRATKREGELAIDVLIEPQRLVVGFDTPVWAHVAAPTGTPASATTLTIDPEPGLFVAHHEATADCGGWVEIPARAEAHVTGFALEAHAPNARGSWFGALPVAAGAFFVEMPRYVPEGQASVAVLVAPNPRKVVYVELDDERGRVLAAALPLTLSEGEALPRARLPIPPLAPGLHWLVVSGEPQGAERLTGATIARPFLVGRMPGLEPERACSLGPWLARRPPSRGFPRFLALDQGPEKLAHRRATHRLGLALGLAALLVAAVLETMLLVVAAREMQSARFAGSERASRASLIVGIGTALLGFALLAALLLLKV